jgi:hypothetical protein
MVEILEATGEPSDEELKSSKPLLFQLDEARKKKEQEHLIHVSHLLRHDLKFYLPLVEGTQVDLDQENQPRVSGSRFWMEELEKRSLVIAELRDLYSNCLNEKRNFLTFALTITTIAFAPMTILTGYWYLFFFPH